MRRARPTSQPPSWKNILRYFGAFGQAFFPIRDGSVLRGIDDRPEGRLVRYSPCQRPAARFTHPHECDANDDRRLWLSSPGHRRAAHGPASCSTAHGPLETPAFMAVGTAGTVKAMTADAVRTTGCQCVLGNTYHLMLRPGADRIAALGRSPSLHGLARAHPDGFRRLSGHVAGRACGKSTGTVLPSNPISTAAAIA